MSAITNLTEKQRIALNRFNNIPGNVLLGTLIYNIINEIDSSPELDITAAIDLSAANKTLSTTEAATGILEVTTGSSTYAIIAPATSGKVYYVVNNDASNPVSIKDASGTAVVIPAGKKAVVYHNGTDYIKLACDEFLQTADLISTNTDDDATGVTWTATKSRATGTTLTDNDVILQLTGVGYNDNATPAAKTLAHIKIIMADATDTSEDGAIIFETMQAGSAAAEVARLDTGLTLTGTSGAQLTIKYDAAAYMTITQANAAGVTFACVSDGTPSFTFSQAVICSGTLESTGNLTVNTDFLAVTALTGDIASKNVQDDATGVTWSIVKSRTTGTTLTDNDVIWELNCTGYNDNATPAAEIVAVMQVLMTDATDTDEDGAFIFKTMVAGAAATEQLRISNVIQATAVVQFGATATAALALGGGTSGSPLTTATADKNFVGLWTQSTATSGDSRALYVRHYLGGTIAATGYGDAIRSFMTVTGTGYSYASGIHATLQINAAATITGSGAAVRATLSAAAESRTLTGKLVALQVEGYIETGNTLPTLHAYMSFESPEAVKIANLAIIPDASNGTIFAAHTTQVMTHSIRFLSADGTAYYVMCTNAATNRS